MDISRIRLALAQLASAAQRQDASLQKVMQRLTAVIEGRCDTYHHCADCAVGCIDERPRGTVPIEPGPVAGTVRHPAE